MKNKAMPCDYTMPSLCTVRERFDRGADLSRGLSGSTPINSQPLRHSQRIERGNPGYGDDIANGATYD
jgi:hypothetical protein